MSKKSRKKQFPEISEEINVDLILATLIEVADLEDDISGIIAACRALEKLKLVQSREWRSKDDGKITQYWMFIATEELQKVMKSLGMLVEFA